MNLIDELKQMKMKGRYVVSLTHVIDRLESIERDNWEKEDVIPDNRPNRFARFVEDFNKGGDSNKTISENDRRSS